MIILRPYQLEGERKIREAFAAGHRAPLYVLSTGGGKTTIFASISHSAMRRDRIVRIMCHRIELIDQIVDTLRKFDVAPGVIASSYEDKGRGRRKPITNTVTVASVQTLVKRPGIYQHPTLFIVDEAHHCIEGNTYSLILKASPDARVLGVTATPCRSDERGLAGHFDVLVRGPSEAELIEQGYLVRTRIFAPKLVDTSGLHVRTGDVVVAEAEALMDKPQITGDAFTHYMQHTPQEQGIVFCTSIKHAINVAARFREGGVSALALNGGTDKTIRRMANQDYRDGKIRVLASCQLFDEGYDVPGARVGIMLAPVRSLRRYRQQKGRTMRPAPGKEFATLLDCVRNCENPGFELAPGETDDWQLTEDAARGKRKSPPGVKICPKCFASSSPQAVKCSNKGCDHVFIMKDRDVKQRDGEIHEITPEELAARAAKRALGFEQFKAETPEALAEVFRKKGYKGNLLGRAKHVLEARQAKKLKESA